MVLDAFCSVVDDALYMDKELSGTDITKDKASPSACDRSHLLVTEP